MSTTSTGHKAEDAAAHYLRKNRYSILARNWRTRFCEIDVIAQKKKIVYFVEVKYRRSDEQGTGLEYITQKKLQQMRFSAEMWINEHQWEGDYSLAAIEVAGTTFQVTNFLPDCM